MHVPTELPTGLRPLRTTPEFDEHSVPPGLLTEHRIAEDVWGRLVVRSGALRFVFEDEGRPDRTLTAGERQVIPPGFAHHLELTGPVRFVIEFHC